MSEQNLSEGSVRRTTWQQTRRFHQITFLFFINSAVNEQKLLNSGAKDANRMRKCNASFAV